MKGGGKGRLITIAIGRSCPFATRRNGRKGRRKATYLGNENKRMTDRMNDIAVEISGRKQTASGLFLLCLPALSQRALSRSRVEIKTSFQALQPIRGVVALVDRRDRVGAHLNLNAVPAL